MTTILDEQLATLETTSIKKPQPCHHFGWEARLSYQSHKLAKVGSIPTPETKWLYGAVSAKSAWVFRFPCHNNRQYAPIAQMIEPLTCKQKVEGLTPSRCSKIEVKSADEKWRIPTAMCSYSTDQLARWL